MIRKKWFGWPLSAFTDPVQEPMSFRVWFSKDNSDSVNPESLFSNPIGISARSFGELKTKATLAFAEFINQQISSDVEVGSLVSVSRLVKLADGTSIIDDDYLRQLDKDVDLVLIRQGQTWKYDAINFRNRDNNLGPFQKCATPNRREDWSVTCQDDKIQQMAKFQLDVYREASSQTRCVRLTTTTGGRTNMSVTYEMRFDSYRAVLQTAFRWAGVLLAWCGRALVISGEYVQRQTNS